MSGRFIGSLSNGRAAVVSPRASRAGAPKDIPTEATIAEEALASEDAAAAADADDADDA
jgi:hypothetical protein